MFHRFLLLSTSLFVASTAAAHPGHGEVAQGSSLAHHLTEPIHVLGTILLIATVLATAHAFRRWRRSVRQPASWR